MLDDSALPTGNYLLNGAQSSRLYFRTVIPEDFEAWLPFYEDPSSTQFWEGPALQPREACRAQFDRIFERYEKSLGGMNALLLKETETFVGFCGLLVQEIDGEEELEIGYSILPAYRRLGYATEAARTCMELAFGNTRLASLVSIIHINNYRSRGVALKNGMHLEKTTVYKENPVAIFRIYRHEYFR
jgi:RimJ/RimL family protein N-acetyltransferase